MLSFRYKSTFFIIYDLLGSNIKYKESNIVAFEPGKLIREEH